MSYQDLNIALTTISQRVVNLTPNIRFRPEPGRSSYQLSCAAHNTLLPALRHDITALSLSLQPSDLIAANFDPLTAYEGFLKLLNHFQTHLDALTLTITNAVNPSSDIPPVNSRLMGRSKCSELCWKMGDLLTAINALMTAYTAYFAASKSELDERRTGVLQQTARAWSVIDQACEFIQQSNLESIQATVKGSIGLLDDALEEVRNALERPGANDLEHALGELSMGEADEERAPDRLTEPERARVNLMIPLIRLCRVLLTKLVKTTNNQPTIFSRMSVGYLEDALECMNYFTSRVDDLVCELDSSPQSFVHIRSALEFLLEDCGKLVKIVTPSLQEGCSELVKTISTGVRKQLQSKGADAEEEWFKIWYTQVQKAAETLLRELV